MQWQDRGLLIGVRPFGECDILATFLTPAHGLASGLVKGGMSRRRRPFLQMGNLFELVWKSRLEEQLGFFALEFVRAAGTMSGAGGSALKLRILASACAVLYDSLADRQASARVYEISLALFDFLNVAGDDEAIAEYAKWERELLALLGFGLSLDKCNATGAREDLCYISPKTGHAVSRAAGEPWHDSLLPMPELFAQGRGDAGEALAVLEYFYRKHIYSENRRSYPYVRASLGKSQVREPIQAVQLDAAA